MDSLYCSYKQYEVTFDAEKSSFLLRSNTDKSLAIKGKLVFEFPISHDDLETRVNRKFKEDCNILRISLFHRGTDVCKAQFRVSEKGISATFSGGALPVRLENEYRNGKPFSEDVLSMSDKKRKGVLCVANGHGANMDDNMVYNRRLDRAICMKSDIKPLLKYDYDKGVYVSRVPLSKEKQSIHFAVWQGVMQQLYGIQFGGINEKTCFAKRPPCGWMTWYAVKFDACEEEVLKNAVFQAQHLKKYGADTIWVDWEWYHDSLDGCRDDGTNTFSPDKQKYPHGMRYLRDKIKELGLIPAIWIGYTNDPAENEYTAEHPEIILTEQKSWCGRYFYDFTHPEYLNAFLPKAIAQIKDWGYEAVKYDTLPIAIETHERFHHKMYNPEKTTQQAFRDMIAKTRHLLGDDMYMLSCAALRDADVLWASDIFDAARIGNDVFGWNEFIRECVQKTIRYYPLHNIQMYCDPDNVVLREEFNTDLQAMSRIYFTALLGMPLTFGDRLYELPDEKLALIKACLPILRVCPKDVCRTALAEGMLVTNLQVGRCYESYNVINVLNTTEENKSRHISFRDDLSLPMGEYHVYDYNKKAYLGVLKDAFLLKLAPYESRILTIRAVSDIPQILSTSRHVSQGAAEIREIKWTENSLHIEADLMEKEPYTVTLFVPCGYKLSYAPEGGQTEVNGNIVKCTVTPQKDGAEVLTFGFECA